MTARTGARIARGAGAPWRNPALAVLAALPAFLVFTSVAAGRWPSLAVATPPPPTESPTEPPTEPPTSLGSVDIAVTPQTAERFGLRVGQSLKIAPIPGGPPAILNVTGIYEALGEQDPFWQ